MFNYTSRLDFAYGFPKYSKPPAFLFNVVDDDLSRLAAEIEIERRLTLIGCGLLLIACEALIEIEENADIQN